MNNQQNNQALVLLSGGMDSATCLYQAVEFDYEVTAMSFRYGQRHKAELNAAAKLAKRVGAKHVIVDMPSLRQFGGSALTDDIEVPTVGEQPGIPVTYVPARNTQFLATALAYCEVHEIDMIYTGVNAVDYSGYPDCREEFVDAFRGVARVATKRAVEGEPTYIRTPLIQWDKATIVRDGDRLGVPWEDTVSCYQADEDGRACGKCEACRLRRLAFEEAGVKDTTRYV